MLESLSKGVYKEEKSISNVFCLVHSICLYFHRCPRICSILANALGLLVHFYGCCLLRVLVVCRLFKGAGWSTKYTMASDSLKIIKYGNLSFKLLINALKF